MDGVLGRQHRWGSSADLCKKGLSKGLTTSRDQTWEAFKYSQWCFNCLWRNEEIDHCEASEVLGHFFIILPLLLRRLTQSCFEYGSIYQQCFGQFLSNQRCSLSTIFTSGILQITQCGHIHAPVSRGCLSIRAMHCQTGKGEKKNSTTRSSDPSLSNQAKVVFQMAPPLLARFWAK